MNRTSLIPLLLLSLSFAGRAVAQCPLQLLNDPAGGYSDWFGYVVSLEDDLMLISSNRDQTPGIGKGTVYVYERVGRRWIERQQLTPPAGLSNSIFGKSSSISGDRLLIGAYAHLGIDSGPAYVYDRTSSGWWELTAMLRNPSPADNDVYAVAVELDGDRAYVATPKESEVLFEAGAVHEWTQSPDGWVITDHLVASDPEAAARFGSTVRTEADLLAISAIWAGPGKQGAVYIFERLAGSWVEVAKLTGDVAGNRDQFGSGLAVDQGRVAIGAPEELGGPGSVYIYERGASGWARTHKLRATDGELADYFGFRLTLRGDRLLVGSVRDDEGAMNAGAAYVFDFTGGGWRHSVKLIAGELKADIRTGEGVAIHPNGVLVTSPWATGGVDALAGMATFFELPTGIRPGCPGHGCPCSNDDTTGGCASSIGVGARLYSCGSSTVSSDDLTLTVVDLPPQQLAVFHMGAYPRAVPFGDGLGCIDRGDVGLFRLGASSTGIEGQMVLGPGIAASTASLGSGAIDPGESWHFQLWYRDPSGPCGSGFNLSNTIEVGFTP